MATRLSVRRHEAGDHRILEVWAIDDTDWQRRDVVHASCRTAAHDRRQHERRQLVGRAEEAARLFGSDGLPEPGDLCGALPAPGQVVAVKGRPAVSGVSVGEEQQFAQPRRLRLPVLQVRDRVSVRVAVISRRLVTIAPSVQADEQVAPGDVAQTLLEWSFVGGRVAFHARHGKPSALQRTEDRVPVLLEIVVGRG